MKKLYLIMALIFFIGCSEKNKIVEVDKTLTVNGNYFQQNNFDNVDKIVDEKTKHQEIENVKTLINNKDIKNVYVVNNTNKDTLEYEQNSIDFLLSNIDYTLPEKVKNIKLIDGLEINASGNKQDNTLIGNSKNNILNGLEGADIMLGLNGNDTYYVDNPNDTVIEFPNQGIDTIQSYISYSLPKNVENLILLDTIVPEHGNINGQDVLIYGNPSRYTFDYKQGDELKGYTNTSTLNAISNLLLQVNKSARYAKENYNMEKITEKDVTELAIKNAWTDLNKAGATNYIEMRNILDSYHIENDIWGGYNFIGMANLIRASRVVIVAVNANYLWGDKKEILKPSANHMITVIGVVYSQENDLLGFYISDSGRGKISDMRRFISLQDFKKIAAVENGFFIYTIIPVKLEDENKNIVGNDLDNVLFGNIGDNIINGGKGNDYLNGRDHNDTYVFKSGDGNDIIKEDYLFPQPKYKKNTIYFDDDTINENNILIDYNNLGFVVKYGNSSISVLDNCIDTIIFTNKNKLVNENGKFKLIMSEK